MKRTGISRVIMSQTELKMQPTIHLQSKLDTGADNIRFALQMYCGLHFQFRRPYYDSYYTMYLFER
jgi:hypothetical protein